jgi:hypothetical protein
MTTPSDFEQSQSLKLLLHGDLPRLPRCMSQTHWHFCLGSFSKTHAVDAQRWYVAPAPFADVFRDVMCQDRRIEEVLSSCPQPLTIKLPLSGDLHLHRHLFHHSRSTQRCLSRAISARFMQTNMLNRAFFSKYFYFNCV